MSHYKFHITFLGLMADVWTEQAMNDSPMVTLRENALGNFELEVGTEPVSFSPSRGDCYSKVIDRELGMALAWRVDGEVFSAVGIGGKEPIRKIAVESLPKMPLVTAAGEPEVVVADPDVWQGDQA